jgi:16S rRNA (guanine(966)-N(2))-methyltransferase RsmD
MRIIAGKFRGRNLKSPPTLDTRPTSDRLRETLFNILAPRIAGARFLDLCAGSGAVGIEALSRGAVHATFVDRSRGMCQLISANLELCRVTRSDSTVITAEAATFLKRHREKEGEAWDIVYYDPPYADDYSNVLGLFADQPELLSTAGLLIVEHDRRKQLPEAPDNLQTLRTLKQGDSSLRFYGPRTTV